MAAFHCQQAVEKYLKAYLLFLDVPFSKTHEIGELITKCETKDNEIFKLKENADKLTDYAVEIRYPGDWFEPTPADAQEALEIAQEIKQFVIDKMRGRVG